MRCNAAGAWLREHLASDYANGWAEIYWNRPSTEFPGQHLVADEAVQDSGAVGGRWNNFYVEMVHQLATVSPKIDGLYLVRFMQLYMHSECATVVEILCHCVIDFFVDVYINRMV
eukprot:COSAG01_NODE_3767_length_5718_cov_4.404342_2_plen_115_part_00